MRNAISFFFGTFFWNSKSEALNRSIPVSFSADPGATHTSHCILSADDETPNYSVATTIAKRANCYSFCSQCFNSHTLTLQLICNLDARKMRWAATMTKTRSDCEMYAQPLYDYPALTAQASSTFRICNIVVNYTCFLGSRERIYYWQKNKCSSSRHMNPYFSWKERAIMVDVKYSKHWGWLCQSCEMLTWQRCPSLPGDYFYSSSATAPANQPNNHWQK